MKSSKYKFEVGMRRLTTPDGNTLFPILCINWNTQRRIITLLALWFKFNVFDTTVNIGASDKPESKQYKYDFLLGKMYASISFDPLRVKGNHYILNMLTFVWNTNTFIVSIPFITVIVNWK